MPEPAKASPNGMILPKPAYTPKGATLEEAGRMLQGALDKEGSDGAAPAGEPGTEASAPSDSPKTLTGKVKVDWGGVPRDVDIAELVSQAQEVEQARQMKAAADHMLKERAGLDAIAKVLNEMTPEEQRAFGQVLSNPKLLRNIEGHVRSDPDDDDGAEEEIAELLKGKPATGKKPARQVDDELTRRLALLEEGQGKMLEFLTHQMRQENEQTLTKRVDEAMAEFQDVFKEEQTLTEHARKNIIRDFAADPNQNLKKLAAKYATETNKILTKARESATLRRGASQRGADIFLQDTKERPSLTGKDLENGAIRRELERRLGRFG